METIKLATEQRNPQSYRIDTKETKEILTIINNEDHKVAAAVKTAIPQICNVVENVIKAFNNDGHLYYIGAGTSGRLGVLDASECPPTFGVPLDLVKGIIAGGEIALTRSIENAEDNGNAGIKAVKENNISKNDVLIGISASGGPNYVVEALKYAKQNGVSVAAISCNKDNKSFEVCGKDNSIYLPVGPEIITGSTRMKAGTAQKLVLNMITTTAMIKTGKVYNNLMVNLQPVNIKLIDRAINLISEVTGYDYQTSEKTFYEANKETKTAMIMLMLNIEARDARTLLNQNNGSINKVLDKRGVKCNIS
ncbi:MAG: N-acetylmuramic acid 6-phosphate etherase [Pleomorphochaeta sp.]